MSWQGSWRRRVGRSVCHLAVLLGLWHGAGELLAEELRWGRPFGDHMVLPAGRSFAIWGDAKPGEEVRVEFAGRRGRATADDAGAWRVVFPALEASAEGRKVRLRAAGRELRLEDVLVGELWFCSGQSNMDFPMSRAIGGGQEIARAEDFPAIRLLNLAGLHTAGRAYGAEERERLTPERFFTGSWQRASAESLAGFSAVGWWAGREIHRHRGVPVGLIDNSVGGCGAEAWLAREWLEPPGPYAGKWQGDAWLRSERISAWARGRAALNLGGQGAAHPFQPGFLHEAGLRWWRGLPAAGVLWYQGETNAEILDDEWNERLLRDVITGWRRQWDQETLPFFLVGLPRIGGSDPLRAGWPRFREVQQRVAERLERVTLVPTQDLGWDSPDVHPPDKQPVGVRLGKAAAGIAVSQPGSD